jgi:hypothetical protein
MISSLLLRIAVRMARHRQILSDQLVLGLVTGGLLGPGLVIEGRESNLIRFAKIEGLWQKAPDRGQILLSVEENGETLVDCQVWCRGLLVRRVLAALLGGAACFAVTRWGLGWALGQTLGLALAVVAAWTSMGWWSDRNHLRRQVTAYLRNTTYLKSV